MQKVVCVSSAKVPIVKIWDPELKLACDMNVNNTLALENTRMVRTYVSIDDRVRQLAMIIKYWTRRRVINDAGKQQHGLFLSSTSSNIEPRSFRWNFEFIYLDLYDNCVSAITKSASPTGTSSAG